MSKERYRRGAHTVTYFSFGMISTLDTAEDEFA